MKEIQLSQNQVAIVDDSDFEALNAFNWYNERLNAVDAWQAAELHDMRDSLYDLGLPP